MDEKKDYVVGSTESVRDAELVIGTTQLYKEGKLRLIPMPSPDPKDPLNLPTWRKRVAVFALCFFGALSLTAEVVIGSLIPIFLLEYAGVDTNLINREPPPVGQDPPGGAFGSNSTVAPPPQGPRSGTEFNPLAVLPPGVKPPDLDQVALLATLPLLTNGIASYLLVPLSIAIGRRPVLILAATSAWAGGLWAGASTSLTSHLVARALQGLGAGAVEALIPLVVQDMFFIHQRNKWMSTVISSQGAVIIALGIATPYIAANHSWRWLYWITSGFGILAWLTLIAVLPETRWKRSKEELSGQSLWPLEPGQDRPAIDPLHYGPRTLWTDIGIFNIPFQWKDAGTSMLNTLRTTFYPVVVWATLANAILLITMQAGQLLTSFALIAQGFKFQHTGIAYLPFVFAATLAYFLGGPIADRVSLAVTRRQSRRQAKKKDDKNGNNEATNNSTRENKNGTGVREAEHNLPNFIIPFVCSTVGVFVFGLAIERRLHWMVLFTGSFLIATGFISVMPLVNVLAVESYPMWAGPLLVNVSSLRIIIAFFFASRSIKWVAQKGALAIFAIYGEVIIIVSLGIPLLFIFGRRLRAWTAGKVKVLHSEVDVGPPGGRPTGAAGGF